MWRRLFPPAAGAAMIACASPTASAGVDGVLTADVQMTVPNVFDGLTFAAVINPDADYAGKIMPTNTSGVFTGDANAPDTFSYLSLPVYAIVDDIGAPWGYEESLFAEVPERIENLDMPLFGLLLIGTLDLTLEYQGAGLYAEDDGTFHDVINNATYPLTGSVGFVLPPFGQPNYLWYGMGDTSIGLGAFGRVVGVSIESNDAQWMSGWPGATLDKNFFPIPEPAAFVLVGAACVIVMLRRRA